ncbi:hypothetical protein [Pseudarthrobacter albicanus]|uniref:hypothetical protein n=1 Tax=Pseudarthrobacter albicanus TaxID=2823873 RepID=UPI001BA97941|nr:hypothetical protein [Pseudarthrobacter albicanus]
MAPSSEVLPSVCLIRFGGDASAAGAGPEASAAGAGAETAGSGDGSEDFSGDASTYSTWKASGSAASRGPRSREPPSRAPPSATARCVAGTPPYLSGVGRTRGAGGGSNAISTDAAE